MALSMSSGPVVKARASLVSLIIQATEGWTVETFRKLIDVNLVPDAYIDMALRHVKDDLTLLSVTDPEFLLACKEGRPDLHGELITDAGRAWLALAIKELNRRALRSPLRLLGV